MRREQLSCAAAPEGIAQVLLAAGMASHIPHRLCCLCYPAAGATSPTVTKHHRCFHNRGLTTLTWRLPALPQNPTCVGCSERRAFTLPTWHAHSLTSAYIFQPAANHSPTRCSQGAQHIPSRRPEIHTPHTPAVTNTTACAHPLLPGGCICTLGSQSSPPPAPSISPITHVTRSTPPDTPPLHRPPPEPGGLNTTLTPAAACACCAALQAQLTSSWAAAPGTAALPPPPQQQPPLSWGRRAA